MKLDDEVKRLNELEQKMAEIQKEAQEIRTRQKRPVMSDMVESMIKFDIDPQEVVNLYHQRTGTPSSSRKLGPAPAKYRNPKTGATWTGRGKAPRWLVEEEEQGTSRDKFLVEQQASA